MAKAKKLAPLAHRLAWLEADKGFIKAMIKGGVTVEEWDAIKRLVRQDVAAKKRKTSAARP